MTRQIALDTETTGLEVNDGHRIIAIGAVEIVNRKLSAQQTRHYLINPQREIDAGALQVHGISLEELQHKPLFAGIADEFIDFIAGAELLIHNAPFDVGFLNNELALFNNKKITDICQITDTLALAREKYPGQRNSLDALCKRLGVDNSARELHGALIDSQILAEVYLAMTGGQLAFEFEFDDAPSKEKIESHKLELDDLIVLLPDRQELAAHNAFVEKFL